MLFLVHYDRQKSKVMSFTEYQEADRSIAYQDRLALEMQHNIRGGLQEIVLLEAVDKDQLRKTHPKYVTNSLGETLFIAAAVVGLLALLKS